MAITPSFYLKTPKKDESLIYMGVRLSDNKVFKYYLKVKVIPELFDKGSQRAVVDPTLLKPYKSIDPNILPKQKQVNAAIQGMEGDVNKIIRELLAYEKAVTRERLKERLDELYRPKIEITNEQSFLAYLDHFIIKLETGDKLHKGKRYTAGTIKTYKVFRTLIDDYDPHLKFENIDMEFYRSFVQFLNSRNYKVNSVGKNIKFIKVIMKDAFEAGLHNNMVYTHKNFEVVTESTDEVYLTQLELDKLYELDLSSKPSYELARDVFLCGCYTALRFSDYSRLNDKMITKKNSTYYISLNTQKTNTKVIIPLKTLVVSILKKYNYKLPKTYEQKVNRYMKEVCKLAGIDYSVEITATIGGRRISAYKPKNELVKTHTARRTGATLLYMAGVAPIDIMKITGHTTEANLLKYIRITKEQTANRLAENSFFK